MSPSWSPRPLLTCDDLVLDDDNGSSLREKIDTGPPRLIHTVEGVGYRLDCTDPRGLGTGALGGPPHRPAATKPTGNTQGTLRRS
jgi:hypothetical protein